MEAYICTTCGVQYDLSETVPAHCPICEDERQYVNPAGQSWTTLEQLNAKHKNVFELVSPGVYAIYTTPSFAIGQRAHLIISSGGNILWDCITALDQTTINIIKALGGIKAIAISHPHYYSTIAGWSTAFNNAPVYVSKEDEQWLGKRPEALQLWQGDELALWDGFKIIRCGGHFAGACVLHNPAGKGSLFVGDTIQVAPDLKTVSFMYSYPNMIPLPQKDILHISKAIETCDYDSIYGAFGRYILNNAKASMRYSVDRYLKIYN